MTEMRWVDNTKRLANGSPENSLTVGAREAARLVGISERHLWTLLQNGRFGPQPLRFGRAVRFNRAEIEIWLAAGAPPRSQWKWKATGTA